MIVTPTLLTESTSKPMPSVLAIIPARGGSKGVPYKNIKPLNGIPLLAHTINCAKSSMYISDIIVSTDSQKIADISLKYGVEVTSLRPAHLSHDTALTIDVITYELSRLSLQGYHYDYILLLQPTSPLRTSHHVDHAISDLSSSHHDTLISVTDVGGHHPLRMKAIHNGILVNYIDTGIEDMRPRNSLPKVYIRNGAIYLKKTEALLRDKSFGSTETLPFVMDDTSSVNIDTSLDFAIAEMLIRERCQ
jgi:CMP-N,N'-diacetyllegionaminic acid synthase